MKKIIVWILLVACMQAQAVLQITNDRCDIVGNKTFDDLAVLKSFPARFNSNDFYLKFVFDQSAEDQRKFFLGSIKVCRADAKSATVDTIIMVAKDFLVDLEVKKTLIPDSNGTCRLATDVTLHAQGNGKLLSLIIARDIQLSEQLPNHQEH